jgi:hypothetical protein
MAEPVGLPRIERVPDTRSRHSEADGVDASEDLMARDAWIAWRSLGLDWTGIAVADAAGLDPDADGARIGFQQDSVGHLEHMWRDRLDRPIRARIHLSVPFA